MKKASVLLIMMIAAFVVLTACGKGGNNTSNSTVTPSITSAVPDYYHECTGEIKLGEYKGIKVTQEKAVVTEADIDKEFEGLLEEQPNYEIDATRAGTEVKEGDALNIDYAGKIAGVAFDGGTAKDQFLVIGSKRFIDGFESSLIGKKVGDTVDINVTFPDPYPNNASLAGAAAVFTVKINYVGKKVDEVTDAYVERYFSSIAHTVADLREYARTELQKNAEANAERKAYNAVLETAMANAEYVSINQDDVDYFYNMTTATIRQYASMYGQSEETVYSTLYQNAYGTYQEFVQQAKDHALTSTKQYMLLQAIAKAENITVTDEEYKTAVEGYMAESSITDFTQFETTYGKDYLSYLALCDKTLKFLHESAVITKEE